MIVMNHDKATEEEWIMVGKVQYHTKSICDVLYIQQAPSATKNVHFQSHNNKIQTVPRLISLSQDRVKFILFLCGTSSLISNENNIKLFFLFLLHIHATHIFPTHVLKSSSS